MKNKVEFIIKWITNIGTLLTFLLTIASIFIGKKIENPEGLFEKIYKTFFEYRSELWVSFVSFSILFFFYQAYRINKWFTLGFKGYFRMNLDEDWDYNGDWRIT